MDPRFGETETAAAFKITSSLQFNFILLKLKYLWKWMGEFEIGRCNFFADLILTFNSGVCFQNGLLLLINWNHLKYFASAKISVLSC